MVYTGEEFKQVRVGQLGTAVGTINMAVAYRTKMTISPTQAGRDNTIMLKSDHFLKDLSPKNIRYHHINKKNFSILTSRKMANTLTPLSKDQIDNLFYEINDILEADLKDDTQQKLNFRNFNVLPTTDTFDKAAVVKFLRILEPNSVIFFQDIQKLLQMHLDKNVLSFESEGGDYLKEKYFIRDETNSITLARVAALFPSLACNLLKCSPHIARPISQHELLASGNYPHPMTSRCFFSLIPLLTPIIGKLKIIEAALLYQVLEQAKFNAKDNYAEKMGICIDYCSYDYLTEYEAKEKRIQHFDELELLKYGYPIPTVYEASGRLHEIVGNKFTSDIILKSKLIAVD